MKKQSPARNRKLNPTRAQKSLFKSLKAEHKICAALVISGLVATVAQAAITIQNPGTLLNANVSLSGAGNTDAGAANTINSLTLAPATGLTLGGVLTLTSSATNSITTTAGAGVSTISGAGSMTTGAATAFTVSAASDLTISTIISGVGGLTKSGVGTVTLGAANTYSGLTTVSSGTLAYGISNAIAGGGVTVSGGVLNVGTFTDSVGAVTISSGGLKVAANQTAAAQLVSTGAVSLAGNLDLTGMSTTAGLYRIASGVSLSGSFATVTGLNSAYALRYSGTELDAQHLATAALLLGPGNVSNVHVGAQTINLLIGNTAPTGSTALNYTLTGITGSGTRAAGDAGAVGAITGSYVATAGANNLTITVVDPNSTNSGAASVSYVQTAYNLAGAAASQTVNVGPVHVGANATAGVVLTNTSTAGVYTETLQSSGFSATTPGFTTAGSVSGIVGGGTGGGLTVGLGNALPIGHQVGTTTLGLASNAVNGSGLGVSSAGNQVITITGDVFSGKAEWNNASSGSWATDNNWKDTLSAVTSGAPGLAGFAGDTATFGTVPGAGTVTVSLNGSSPVLATLTFNNSNASYVVAQGSGGSLILNNSGAGATLTGNAGIHTISAPVVLADNLTASVASGTVTVSGAISESGGSKTLLKNGAGTLVLAGANTYSGLTTANGGVLELKTTGAPAISGSLSINSGTVQLDQSNQIAAGQGVGVAGGVLALQANNNTVAGVSLASGSITGSGTLTSTTDFAVQSGAISASLGGGVGLAKTGVGIVVLSGSNVYTGLTSVSGGVLELNTTGSPAISGSVSITAGTVQLDQNDQIASGKGVGVAGGILSLQANSNTVAGVSLTNSGSITGSGTLTSTTAFDLESGSVAAHLSGTSGVVKSGVGVVTLTGSNSYLGGTSITNGTLLINGAGTLGSTSGALSVTSGGILNLGTTTQTVGSTYIGGGTISLGTLNFGSTLTSDGGAIGASLAGGGTLTQNSNTLTLSGANSYSGGTVVNGGLLQINGAGTLGSTTGALAVNLGGTLDLGSTTQTVGAFTLHGGTVQAGTLITSGVTSTGGNVSAVLAGSGGLTLTTGVLTLTGANLYTGLTDVQGGTLILNTTGSPAIAGNLKVSGGTAQLSQNNEIKTTSVVTVTAGSLNLATFNNTVAGVHLLGGSIAGTGGTLASTTPYDLQAGTVSAHLAGSVGLVKTGAGTVTLSAANSYSGGTTVSNGLLQIANPATLGAVTGSLLVNNVGILDLGATTQTVGTVNIANSGVIRNGTLIGSSYTSNGGAISAILAGPGGLTQNSGVLTLSGQNTYSGPTVVNGGTLLLNTSGGPAIVGNLTINGGVVQLNQSNQIGAGSNVTVAGGSLALQNYSDTVNSFHLASGSVVGGGTLNSLTGFVVDSGTISASLTGVGGLTKNTGGTVYLTGSNDYTGLTQINAGILYAFNIPGALNITGGQLIFIGNGIVPSGVGISSLPLVSVLGTGFSVIQSGAIAPLNYFINTTVRNPNGDLQIQSGGELIGGVQVKKGFLVVDAGGRVDGPLTLTGPHAEARIDGMLGDSRARYHTVYGASVNAGAYLHGNGMIMGNVVNAGTVSAGNSPGKLTIGGNFTQIGSGTILQDLAAPTSYDKLVIGGYAKLSGAVRVNYLNGFAAKVGDSFTILSAAGGVHGQLSLLDPHATGTLLTLGLVYKPTSLLLEYTQGSFASLNHLTPNQLAVAHGLDKLAARKPNSNLIGKLDTFQLGSLPAQLEKLSPSGLAAIFEQGIATESIQSSNVQRRLQEIRNGASGFSASGANITDSHGTLSCDGIPLYGAADSSEVKFTNGGGKEISGTETITTEGKGSIVTAGRDQRWGTFLAGSGEFTHIDGDSNAKGTDFTTGGVTLGVDYRLSNNLVAGLMAGYANTTTGKSSNGSVDTNAGKGGVYGTYYQDGLYFDGSFDFGGNSYDTKRSTLGGEARGSATGWNWNGLIGGGYDRKTGALAYGPVASVQYTHIGIDQFTETGSLSPLTFPGQSQDSLRTQAGFHVSYALKLGSMFLTPDVRVQWQHEFMDSTSSISSRFAGGTNSFTVQGPALKRDSIWVDAGASLQVNQNFSVFTYFTGDFGRSNYSSNAVNGGVRINF